jgi:hypothetical protein
LHTDEQRSVMLRHAELVRSAAQRAVDEPADLEDVEAAFRQARSALRLAPHEHLSLASASAARTSS